MADTPVPLITYRSWRTSINATHTHTHTHTHIIESSFVSYMCSPRELTVVISWFVLLTYSAVLL